MAHRTVTWQWWAQHRLQPSVFYFDGLGLAAGLFAHCGLQAFIKQDLSIREALTAISHSCIALAQLSKSMLQAKKPCLNITGNLPAVLTTLLHRRPTNVLRPGAPSMFCIKRCDRLCSC